MKANPQHQLRALTSRRGAIDLPSIMIGVAVVAILSVGITATVFGAIPWAQNHSAKQNIVSVRSAEGIAANSHGKFLDTAALKKAGYLESTAGIGIVTNGKPGEKGCFVTVMQSKSGKMFYGSDTMTEAAELKTGAKDPCVLGVKLQDAIDEAGGKIIAGKDTYTMSTAGAPHSDNSAPPATFSTTFAKLPGLDGKSITEAAAGIHHSCVIADNEPWCWGWESAYRLGNKNGGPGVKAAPVKASTSKLPAGAKLHSLSTHWATTCLVAAEKPYCWGNNNAGNINPAGVIGEHVPEPTLVPGMAARKVSQVSAGFDNTCAVSDGAAWCWGSNGNGMNGNGVIGGATATYQIPTKVGGALANKTVTSVEVGRYNACAIADGSLYCWGSSSWNQLPTGTAVSATPVKIGGLPKGAAINDVSVGQYGICAVVDTNAWCWGSNASGQIGNGTLTAVKKPYLVKGALQGKSVESVVMGRDFTCATASDDAYCWGTNLYGQTGTGNTGNVTLPVKVAVAANQKAVLLSASQFNSYLVTAAR